MHIHLPKAFHGWREFAPQLSFLSFNQKLEPQARVEAAVTLGRLDSINASQAQLSRQMLGAVRTGGIPLVPIHFGASTVALGAATERMLTALRDRYGGCVVDVRMTPTELKIAGEKA
jgi:hypothetical protein